MGDEADALEGQSDEGAEEHFREYQRERAQKQRSFANAVKAEVARQLKAAGVVQVERRERGAMATYKCKSCQCDFVARIADRKRGWARFCSKSCKAVLQDARTGGVYRGQYDG